MRQHNRAAIGQTKLIADEGRNSARIGGRGVVEIVARIEGRVAKELKVHPMHLVCAGFRNDVCVAGRAFAQGGRHNAGEGIDALDGVDVEIGNGAPS